MISNIRQTLLRGEKIRVRNVEILDGDSLGVTLPTGERSKSGWLVSTRQNRNNPSAQRPEIT